MRHLVLASVGLGLLLIPLLPEHMHPYLAPTVACVTVFLVFSVLLHRHVGEPILGEIGFLYLGIILAYTVLPAIAFMMIGFDDGSPLSQLLPDPAKLNRQLWRQAIYAAGVAAGYLLVRVRLPSRVPVITTDTQTDGRTLVVAALVIVVCLSSLVAMSGPVTSYYEHYTRFDHLPWLQHKFASLSIRLSLGLYCVVLVFMFRNYKRYKAIIPLTIAAICAYEMTYSYGARIQSLIVLLQAVCLYHYLVRRISLKVGLIAFLCMATLFSATEVIRRMQGDFDAARALLSEEGLRPATEFGAVFYPGYHLYEEREQGTLAPTEWPMFFNDAISLVTFGDFTRWNPMNWYATNYYPDVEIPPFTVGPIAESALWGGGPDMVVRSLLNGLFFAYLMRWFIRHGTKWWGLAVYVYCYATCILTLKYSVFLHLSLIEKNLLPTLLLAYVVRSLRFARPAFRAARTFGHVTPTEA
jgi:hypothetical protein